MKPRIGITLSSAEDATDQNYVTAVERAGGTAILLRPGMTPLPSDELDGLLMSGGVDVEPSRYGEVINGSESIEHDRDALEFEVLERAREKKIPVLGICRGFQLLNIAYGGKLIQDMKGHRSYPVPGEKSFRSVVHQLTVARPDTKFARAVSGAKYLQANSRHHQAVRESELAPGMIAVASSPDGYIEVIEADDDQWVIGVQCHPERSFEVDPRFVGLFDEFIGHARRRDEDPAKPAPNDGIVRVALEDRSYNIVIGEALLGRAAHFISKATRAQRVFIAYDANVQQHLEPLVASLRDAELEVYTRIVPSGEESKNLEQLNALWDDLLARNLGRSAAVVALGGGMVGDLVGFAAATYLRGVDFVQIPTSLLAMVDASVGGKTAVNHPRGKNLLGAFWQPRLVLIDTDTLKTLPEGERTSALAEIIKYGVIEDASFFAWLEHNIVALRDLQPDAVRYAIRRSCEIKAAVVGADERESGVREILNFGHTVAHAIENVAEYGSIRHGDAVAIGMVAESLMGIGRTQRWSLSDHNRLVALIDAAGLPWRLPAGSTLTTKQLFEAARYDKKNRGGPILYMLPTSLGKVEAARVEDSVAQEALLEIGAVKT